MSISLKRSDLDLIIDDARKAFPNEACGLLAGNGSGVSKVYRMANTEKGGLRYAVSPKEQFEAVRRMRAEGTGMVGIYHSHPNTRPYPSARDMATALNSGCSYLIVSLMRNVPEVRSFRINGGRAEEESVDVG